MHKHVCFIILLCSLLLSGCFNAVNNSDNTAEAEGPVEQSDQALAQADYEAILKDYKEFPHIEDTIANIAALDIEITEDNAHKRIILFTDDHDIPAYKSIFTKQDSHLKIIQLNTDHRPLFDEDIEQ